MTWNAGIAGSPTRQAFVAGAAAFVLAAILLASRVFVGPLRHWDEAWYAQVSREMLQSDDWMTPRWNGEPWFHKPPLAFWGTMASYSAFGESEASARLFSAACGAMTAGAAAAFIAFRFGVKAALFGTLLLVATPGFARYCARGQLDGPLTLFVTLHLLCFWFARTNPCWHWTAGGCFGLAIMTKGAAAGLALVVIGVFSISMRDFGWLRQRAFWGGMLIALLIAAPWHVHQLMTNGEKFLNDYGARHFTQFFDRIPGEDTPGPRWDYYLQFLLKSAPWGWMVVGLAAAAVVALTTSRDPLLRFSAAWTVAVPVALSFARTKWLWYLTPMYPGAALLAVQLAGRSTWICAHRRTIVSVCALVACGVAVEPFALGPKEGEAEIKAIAPLVQQTVAPVAGVHTLQLGKVRRSVYPIALLYYSQRRTDAIHSWEELERILAGERRCINLLLRESELDELKAHLPQGDVATELLGSAGDLAFIRIRSEGRVKSQSSMALQAN